MDADLWLRGLVIGLAIAAPVGPIGVLCIRRTLAEGRAIGFASGLGAATADAFYGSIAGLGITSLSSFLVGGTGFLRFFGGLFLIYLGVRTFLARPTERAAATSRGGLPAAYASTFLLTLANPATILSFAAVFAGLGAGSAGRGYAAALLLVGGVFCGSALWWFSLSGGGSLLRARFTPDMIRWVNRGSGAIIAGFGLVALLGR